MRLLPVHCEAVAAALHMLHVLGLGKPCPFLRTFACRPGLTSAIVSQLGSSGVSFTIAH